MRRLTLLPILPALLAIAVTTAGQGAIRSLEPGNAVEKTLSTGQTHSYVVAVDKNQFVLIAVEQRNIDIVVRVFLPDGKPLAEVDSPTGTDGVEYVEFVAESNGNYRIEVSQLPGGDASGQYEIKIEELRKATEQELQALQNDRTRKEKGRALLIETMPYFDQLRLPETRVELRIRTAELIRESDAKQASKLIGLAVEDVKAMIAGMPGGDEFDYESIQTVTLLRQLIINALAPHDPEAALKFFQSTRIPGDLAVSPNGENQELQLEFQLVNQVAAADSKRAFDLAQDLLKRTSSVRLVETLTRLAVKDRELAGRFAHDIAVKLMHQELVKSREAAYLAASLMNTVRTSQVGAQNNGDAASSTRLLSDNDYRDLFLKLVSEVMSFSTPADGPYAAIFTPEHDAVRGLAAVIRQMPAELRTYAADRAGTVEKKIVALIGETSHPAVDWQRYQTAIHSAPVETALETITEAPAPMRDYLYQQVATKTANSGDMARARQIVERMSSPEQRQRTLHALQQQAVTLAADKGRFDEALRLLTKFRPGAERDELVTRVLTQLDRGIKKQMALQYLAQGKNLITSSPRADNQQKMHNLLVLARAFARYDLSQAFEIVEPLLNQFNEISAAAVTMNGFAHDYYREGELITSNENPISDTADQISGTLATLARFDFDRAKTAAEGISRIDVRVRIFLQIAQSAMEIPIKSDEATGYGSNQ